MGRQLLWLAWVAAACGGCGGLGASATPETTERPVAARGGDPAAIDEDAVVLASAGASALVFRPPAGAHLDPADLARHSRQPSAFIGFEEPITESYRVTTVDRQISGGGLYPLGFGGTGGYLDRYEREAVIEKVGVLHR